MRTVNTKSNGKIILTGEHSVVHEQSAIAMPFYAHTYCNIQENKQNKIAINLNDLNKTHTFSSDDIVNLKSISPNEFSLPIYILHLFYHEFDIPLSNMMISIDSEIPISLGLGSSAAFIISMMTGLIEYYNLELNENKIFELAVRAENLVHGKSSGLDIHVALHNQTVKYQQADVSLLSCIYSIYPNFHIINTGKPSSTTLDCVESVNKHFKNSQIWECFGKVASEIESAVSMQDFEQLKKQVRINHQLLCEIGIVPLKIQQFIRDIENMGGSAKISGSGSITGNNAGILIVLIESVNLLHEICAKYNYEYVYNIKDNKCLAK